MTSSPLLGVLFHWLGGLAAGSFYVPYKKVRKWSWETYWLAGGFFSWLVAPWVCASIMTSDLIGVLARTPGRALFWAWFFGLLWGIGGLTFGLAVRYLGMSLGYGVALGICAVCGTLIPSVLKGSFGAIASSQSGQVSLLGIGVCVIGITLTALAGLSKEREMPAAAKQKSVREFNFRKGIAVAIFCGLMSACFAFGLEAAAPLAALSAAAGTPLLWTGLPKLVVILGGGFTSNAVWCIYLHRRRGSGGEYLARFASDGTVAPRFANLCLCAFAGVTWYFQFFFYTMGETQMGDYGFSSWTLHMASIIIFSAIWGLALREWRGTSRRTHGLIAAGIVVLIFSTVIVGYGTYLNATTTGAP